MFGRIDPIPEALKTSRLAQLLPGQELRLLEQRGTMLRLPAGRVVMRQHEIGRECMIVADGTFTVSKGGEPVARLTVGDVMGELALITHKPRTATVTADEDSLVYVFNPREFRSVLDSCPTLARMIHEAAEGRAAA